jgi:hypothetical protein
MSTLSLDAIQQRIAQHDSELRTLRQELEARQSRLQSLSNRKQELRKKLQEIEAEIAAITVGTPRSAGNSLKPKKHKAPSKQLINRNGRPTLANLIVAIIKNAGRGLTVQQITQGVRQRGFPSKSKALHKLVGKNVYSMATKGILKRTKDKPAAFSVPTGKSASPSDAKQSTTTNHKPAHSDAKKPGSGSNAVTQIPLKQLLAQILQQSQKPMTGGDLATAALKAGYKTKSKRLVDSVWTALANMKNVENIKGQGYRIKKSK